MTQHEAMKPLARVTVGGVTFAQDAPIAVLAGPCQMESRAHALEMASALKEAATKLGIGLVYKSSFDKANRTSLSGRRGIGLEAALPVFAEIRESLGLPVVTDVHEIEQCARVAEVVDILQIPAFLCRQTDLLIAAANTGRVVKIKKGQFLAPWDMKNVVAKVTGSGNPNVLVTERGSSFGYNTLVVDMRGLPQMAEIGAPVIFEHELTPCSSRAGRARLRAAIAGSCRCWRGRQWLLVSRGCLSKRTKIRITRRRTGRTWCRSRILRP